MFHFYFYFFFSFFTPKPKSKLHDCINRKNISYLPNFVIETKVNMYDPHCHANNISILVSQVKQILALNCNFFLTQKFKQIL